MELILLCLQMILEHRHEGRRIYMQGSTERLGEQTISLDQEQGAVAKELRNERDVGRKGGVK